MRGDVNTLSRVLLSGMEHIRSLSRRCIEEARSGTGVRLADSFAVPACALGIRLASELLISLARLGE